MFGENNEPWKFSKKKQYINDLVQGCQTYGPHPNTNKYDLSNDITFKIKHSHMLNC